MPGKIQENLAALELEATPSSRLSGLQSPVPSIAGNHGFSARNTATSNLGNGDQQTPLAGRTKLPRPDAREIENADQPRFSPFPPLKKRPVNVPPTDEEKQVILEKARAPVLNSNDPEIQLTWAQDALIYCEVAAQEEERASDRYPRPHTPQIEHNLRIDAINIIQFLANQSHPKAEFLKGTWLEFGKFGFRMDKKEAFRCYQRAASRGFARAEYRMGMQFESSNEPDKAIRHYSLGMQQGDSASHYRLGMMTLLGQHGQPLDCEKGIKLISYSAETADENAPQGAYMYGMLQARDLPQVNLPEHYLALNIAGARFNIEKAAYLGFAKAQTKMGAAYELCQLGCEFDPSLSLHYNALAARQCEADAELAISKWFLCGYEGLFEANEKIAFDYALRAANSGLATAEFAMGYFYEVGIHVSSDLSQSRTWYSQAAEHGNRDASARLDGLSRSKTLSRKDHESVAVAKIQSQYRSQRGKRPDRFKDSTTPMPTIADDYNPVNMPEPKLPKPRPGEYRSSPYTNNPGPDFRPQSTAPYPLDDHPSRIPPLNAQPSNPAIRKPILPHPNSPDAAMTSFGDNNYRGSAFPTFKPSPNPSAVNRPPPGHKPSPSPATPPVSGRQRLPPLAVPPDQQGPSSAQGAPYRKPVPSVASPHTPASPVANHPQPQTQPPTIDIGFSAPPDLSGADKPRRSQRPPDASRVHSPPGPLPRISSSNGLAGRQQDRLSSLPHSATMPPGHGFRPASPQIRPMSAGRPGTTPLAHRPSGPTVVDGASLESHGPPAPPKGDHYQSSATPAPNAPKPPGKGPKTFSEMGLPPTKQENDCVSFVCTFDPSLPILTGSTDCYVGTGQCVVQCSAYT